MLATMNPSHRDVPLREHSHLNLHQDNHENLGDNMGLEDRLCPGCKKSAVSEQGGLVVAFGYVCSFQRRISCACTSFYIRPFCIHFHRTHSLYDGRSPANPSFMSIASNAPNVATK